MRVGETSSVAGGAAPLPESDQIILSVFAQLGIVLGQAAELGEFDKGQITVLINQLETINDRHRPIAHELIRMLTQFERTGNFRDLLRSDEVLTRFLSHIPSSQLSMIMTDEDRCDIAFGNVGLAYIFEQSNPRGAQANVQKACDLLSQIGAISNYPLLQDALQKLQGSPPDIAGALNDLAQISPP